MAFQVTATEVDDVIKTTPDPDLDDTNTVENSLDVECDTRLHEAEEQFHTVDVEVQENAIPGKGGNLSEEDAPHLSRARMRVKFKIRTSCFP